MASSPYLEGRTPKSLNSNLPATTRDALFAAQRIDGTSLIGKTFEHCTFANISFKGCSIRDCRFVDCVFLDCYFRESKLDTCTISASKFIDCNLLKIDIRSTIMKNYNTFRGCYIPFNQVIKNIPAEGNLKAHLCGNLANEALSLGAWKESQRFRQVAAEGLEQSLWQIVTQATAFERDKYDINEQVKSFWHFVTSKMRGWIWGYQKSHYVLLRNWGILTFLFFPFLFFTTRSGLTQDGHQIIWQDIWKASIGNMLPGSSISNIKFSSFASETLAFTETFSGVVILGLAVSLLFSASDRKRS